MIASHHTSCIYAQLTGAPSIKLGVWMLFGVDTYRYDGVDISREDQDGQVILQQLSVLGQH